ncbi:MAG: hypothetical protein SGPRY_000240 [Prymnesium sp.]
MADDTPSSLVCLVDASPRGWEREETIRLSEQLLVFLNAFHLIHAANQSHLLAIHAHEVCCVWPAEGTFLTAAEPQQMRRALLRAMSQLVARPASDSPALLSGGLSLALCRLARTHRMEAKRHLRILIFQLSTDSASQHLAVMNCAFAAQKLGVTIDAIVRSSSDSLLLQQVAHLTSGVYLRLDDQARAP